MNKRVLVIGLDCAEPSLVFEKWADQLPNLSGLRSNGVWGRLESTIPPITIPAWASMMTGKLPGTLGFYGFRNRKDYSYEGLSIATSLMLREKTVWDYLKDKKSVVIGFPPSYPPKPINGELISGFLTPGIDSNFTYPEDLKGEILGRFGEYLFDVRNFRTNDKMWLKDEIFKLGKQRMEVARYMMETRDWDFFFVVEMGVDRLHHGFWKFFDKKHRKYEPGNPFEDIGIEYYKMIDGYIGELIEAAGDDTMIMVVSDHGAKRIEGGIVINKFLIDEGYLKLKSHPEGIYKLKDAEIDWENTIAWAEGGYYSRIFLNVKGREPNGKVLEEDYEKVRDELIEKIEGIPDHNGNPMKTRAYRPEEIYPEVKGIPPDLIVIFGNLYWRAVGSLGFESIYTFENDTGPDDANHAQHGIFILSPHEKNGERKGLHITDVAGTLFDIYGIEPEGKFMGKSVLREVENEQE